MIGRLRDRAVMWMLERRPLTIRFEAIMAEWEAINARMTSVVMDADDLPDWWHDATVRRDKLTREAHRLIKIMPQDNRRFLDRFGAWGIDL